MSTAYRDERDAALARVDALLRENARLRAVNGWLHACPGGAPRERVRGALAAAPLMLAAIACAGLVVRDATSHAAVADADLAYAPGAAGPSFTVPDARASLRTLVRDAADGAPSPAPSRAVVALAVAPLLQGCFAAGARRIDVLAAVDGRGHTRHVHVLVEGLGGRALRAERRCVRRALATVTLPTTRADYAVEGSPVHLVVLQAPSSRHRRRAP
jgi:hypothetical protein